VPVAVVEALGVSVVRNSARVAMEVPVVLAVRMELDSVVDLEEPAETVEEKAEASEELLKVSEVDSAANLPEPLRQLQPLPRSTMDRRKVNR